MTKKAEVAVRDRSARQSPAFLPGALIEKPAWLYFCKMLRRTVKRGASYQRGYSQNQKH